jgi:hypothetical protein
MEKSGGLVSFTKRMFWSTFKATWETVMSNENILSAFAKTGIWLLQPEVILLVIRAQRQATPPGPPLISSIATPYTAKAMRQFTIAYWKNPTREAFNKLTKANEINVARASLADFRARGLTEAL